MHSLLAYGWFNLAWVHTLLIVLNICNIAYLLHSCKIRKSNFGWFISVSGILGVILVMLGTVASVGIASLFGIQFGPDALQVFVVFLK